MTIGFIVFNALLISSHYDTYTMGAHGGFWTIFTKNFRLSGYDNWSWITISGMRIHFETIRHPLFLSLLYPFYLINHLLIEHIGYNFAVFFMAIILILSALYSAIFMFRIFREVLASNLFDAIVLTILFFSFAHIQLATIAPDHFIISLMFLTMTLYITGMKLKMNKPLTIKQSFLLNFFTAGITLSNGAKSLLAGLFTNGKQVFKPKFLLLGMVLPFIILLGIQQTQYYLLEVPQKAVIQNIERVNKKKDPKKVEERVKQRDAWLAEHSGKPAGNGFIGKLMDVSTPRVETIIENFFGESIQLHQKYLLKDVSWDRPIFVSYNWTINYVIEGIIVILFILGIISAYKQRFFQLLLAWFACDITLHLILGFAINEVYIMAAGWAFIIPISYAFIAKKLSSRWLLAFRILFLLLTIYLRLYNGVLLSHYLIS